MRRSVAEADGSWGKENSSWEHNERAAGNEDRSIYPLLHAVFSKGHTRALLTPILAANPFNLDIINHRDALIILWPTHYPAESDEPDVRGFSTYLEIPESSSLKSTKRKRRSGDRDLKILNRAMLRSFQISWCRKIQEVLIIPKRTTPRNSRTSRINNWATILYVHINHVKSHVDPTNPSSSHHLHFSWQKLWVTVCRRIHSTRRRYHRSLFPVSELPGAFDFFPVPSKRPSTSLVAVTVCRGFSIGWLYPRPHVDPWCFRGRVCELTPPTL